MDKISVLRGSIKRFYNQIKKPNTCPSKKCKAIEKLEQTSNKYIEALVYDDEIEWQSFFNIIDILNDNISYLKQTITCQNLEKSQ